MAIKDGWMINFRPEHAIQNLSWMRGRYPGKEIKVWAYPVAHRSTEKTLCLWAFLTAVSEVHPKNLTEPHIYDEREFAFEITEQQLNEINPTWGGPNDHKIDGGFAFPKQTLTS